MFLVQGQLCLGKYVIFSTDNPTVGHVIENRFHRRFDGGLVCYQGPQESSSSIILMLFQTCRPASNCEAVKNTVLDEIIDQT